MTPNQVTFVRIGCGFAAVALFSFFGRHLEADAAGIALTVAAIALDGLDGYLARKRGLATPLGAQFDILGDRIIENLFFTFFAASGLISLWVPIGFFARGAATDFLRGAASRAGSGAEGMLQGSMSRMVVASRLSRAAYAALKCLCFCCLGLLVAAAHSSFSWLDQIGFTRLWLAGQWLSTACMAFCLLRAIPVIWEGRRFLRPAPTAPAKRPSEKQPSLAGAAR